MVVKSKIDTVSYPKIKSMISLASDEMTKSKEVVPDWQQAASNILVSIGNKYINDIMEEILSKFQPGILPHFFVVQTLSSLSESNVYGMVPFLNAILGTMLPMLGMAKQDNMKWVFSSALGHFSESILEYLANLDKAPDPTVRKDTFSSEIYAAYDILFNNWLQNREAKLRLTVVESLGPMAQLMPHDKLEEQLPKMIPAVLSLYKKNPEHYIISKSLCQILEAAVDMGSRVLEMQLDNLLSNVHQQACTPVDYANLPTVKNHNEILRCFSILGNTFPDRVLIFVLQKLDNSNERNRMGTLAILRHLINSTPSIMETKKSLVLSSIRQPLQDNSNKVKKMVLQVISAMAHHGYLELEGGDVFIRYIIQHCALPDDINVLWPYLLSFLTPLQYTNAMTPLCKSLILLGNKKKLAKDENFIINFNEQVNLPSPYVLLTRLLVNASFPFRGRGRGIPSLNLLNVMAPNIHPEADKSWETEIPDLVKYLEEVILLQGIAAGIGLCASKHLDDTLGKLEDFGKSEAFKKASGIFGLLKDKNDVDIEKMKSTLILCYGSVTLYAPDDQILGRIEPDILRNISKNFNTKDLTMKLSLIKSIGQIAQAISICTQRQSYNFTRKQELLGVMMHIESWLNSPRETEREKATRLTSELLDFYLANLVVKNMVTFNNLGALLGRLAPRCSDPHRVVRKEAMDCIYTLLYIQLRYEGFALDYKDEAVESLITLRDKLDNPDPTVLYRTCSELTKIISKRLPQHQLSTLIFMLFEGLVDSQPNCSRASSVVINTLLKTRGAGLQELVPEVLEVLHIRLQVITEEQVKVAVGQSVLILATQHLQTVVNALISHPLPFDNWTCEMWLALGADSNLASQIMELIIEKLNVIVPYVEKKEFLLKSGMTKVATNQPLAMTCALREIMLNGKSTDAVLGIFPQLFSALLVRLGSSVGVQIPKDINSNSINQEKRLFSKPPVLLDVCGAMAKHAGPRLPGIVESLCPSLSNIYECQRITVTAFFSELLNHHVVSELMMMDMLMNNMMERISDPCNTIRMLSIRGLGNIAVGSPEKVNKYAKELLAAMSSGMEEKDDPDKQITLEAMSGLSKILDYLDRKNVQLLVVYIFMKIKPFLESENDDIRSAAITLLGNLSRFGAGEPVFKDQLHNVLVSLLLHLNDPSPDVVKACKFAMRVCAPVVGSDQITTMFQNHLHEDKGLHYGEFINDLTKYIIQDFPAMLNFYHITVIQFFKSNWPEVRASAAMFIGLVLLLQDPEPLVRAKAAEAMGRFNQF
ncbi:MROH1 protein, partial [Polypterus senegalus]